MIDSDLVRSRCQEIIDSVERIRKIKMLPLEVFLKDQDQQDIGCYRLQIAIEAALSLCYHITAKELRKVPVIYRRWLGSETCSSICTGRLIIPPSMTLSKTTQKIWKNFAGRL
jgi:hypothetical protein